MRKLLARISCALILSLAFVGSVFADEYPEPSSDFYVNDLANIISEENERYIVNTNAELKAKTGGQIVIMTINNLNGKSIETYAYNIFKKYGIGDKSKDNGTLVLISVEDREIRIETGIGAESFIPDARAGRILEDYIKPRFKEDDWDNGVRDGFDAILGCYLQEYNIEIDGNTAKYLSEEGQGNIEVSDAQAGMIFGAFFSTFLSSPIIEALCARNKKRRTLIRWVLIAAAVATWLLPLGEIIKWTLFIIIIFNLLATFGIRMSGGGLSSGGYSSGSRGSGGGHSGGGGSSRGGGASSRF